MGELQSNGIVRRECDEVDYVTAAEMRIRDLLSAYPAENFFNYFSLYVIGEYARAAE